MVRHTKYNACSQVNEAIESSLSGMLDAVLRLQYDDAGRHAFQMGIAYADALCSGVFAGGRAPSEMICPTQVPFILSQMIQENEHDFVLNSSSYKKFVSSIDGSIVAALRGRVPELRVVPEHADATFQLAFAAYVRNMGASAIAAIAGGHSGQRTPPWASRVANWLRTSWARKLDEATVMRLGEIAACLVPGFIAAQGYNLDALDRRTSGILRRMLEQSLNVDGMTDVAMAVGQLDALARQAPQRLHA